VLRGEVAGRGPIYLAVTLSLTEKLRLARGAGHFCWHQGNSFAKSL
jgi:hypothetical protein